MEKKLTKKRNERQKGEKEKEKKKERKKEREKRMKLEYEYTAVKVLKLINKQTRVLKPFHQSWYNKIPIKR